MANTISYNEYIDYSPDDNIWKPIENEEIPFYRTLIENVYHTFENGTKKEKGDSMEKLMTFIYQRFKAIKVCHNVRSNDNQIDHIVEFIDGMTPAFIQHYIGLRLIGESKNHKKTIGSREVSNLDELLRDKDSKLGVFSSFYSFSKGQSMWVNAEGKRRKLALKYGRKIIGFTIKELESLVEKNFYTLLKQKFNNLVDEIEDDFSDHDCKSPYNVSLLNNLIQLNNLGIIDQEAFINGKRLIEERYGNTDIE
ncbi:Restriction endonuclease [Schinkia azotoformans MEV2011]|uniref:Restriction endonuclease n=1 Tax=Schinkia azotoformans MEV2011 TaxID=1348973 RepID=A0A072NTB4_SCHAZ|nr:hypothetical protein [Schinkia azotoformans]KEF40472.1 Restriction endonuclease [Schinkia azotoformans MEV2011]MEC1696120.1 hypothetical protein [Schinkia azotoformans]MEC1716666.1 hypothetical protein [Schinkia azotoformans]MEC1725377.1 hypothetical protein [Schinkia azotoformans]MEC1739505.1 hypothetical protein [Schinkia azotoformans]